MQEYFLLIPLLVIGLTPLYLYYKDKRKRAKNKNNHTLISNKLNPKIL